MFQKNGKNLKIELVSDEADFPKVTASGVVVSDTVGQKLLPHGLQIVITILDYIIVI